MFDKFVNIGDTGSSESSASSIDYNNNDINKFFEDIIDKSNFTNTAMINCDKDYYAILGAYRTDTIDDIKNKYNKKIDEVINKAEWGYKTTNEYKDLTDAFDILSIEDNRAYYNKNTNPQFGANIRYIGVDMPVVYDFPEIPTESQPLSQPSTPHPVAQEPPDELPPPLSLEYENDLFTKSSINRPLKRVRASSTSSIAPHQYVNINKQTVDKKSSLADVIKDLQNTKLTTILEPKPESESINELEETHKAQLQNLYDYQRTNLMEFIATFQVQLQEQLDMNYRQIENLLKYQSKKISKNK